VRRLDAAFDDEARLVTIETDGLMAPIVVGSGASSRAVEGGVEPPHSTSNGRS
jgi:hypothetical protein